MHIYLFKVKWSRGGTGQAGRTIEVGPDPNSTAQDQIERCVSAAKERSRGVWRVYGVFLFPMGNISQHFTDASQYVADTAADKCENPEELWRCLYVYVNVQVTMK